LLDVPTKSEGALTVSDPEGNTVAAQVLASGRVTRIALPPAKIPGIYIVKQNGNIVALAAVNVDARESDTRPLALENLKSGENSTVSVLRGEDDLSLEDNIRQLWPALAVAAVSLLGLEMLLLAVWRKVRTPLIKPVEVAS
jgi:hypothetical protein